MCCSPNREVVSSSDKQRFIRDEKEKSVEHFRTFTVPVKDNRLKGHLPILTS